MSRRYAWALAAVCGMLTATAPVLTHDFWLEPSSFRLEPGGMVHFRLRVGEHFIGDPLPRDAAMIAQFIAAGPKEIRPVPGQHGRDPAGMLSIAESGLIVVGYRSRHSTAEQTPKAFDAYLAEEGLDRVAAIRATRTSSSGVIRELFSRCAKVLLVAGPVSGSAQDRILGFTLEIVAEKNPYGLRAGQHLPVRLLYDGQPLEGTLVVAMNRQDPSARVQARSNREGRVSLPLSRGGVWMIKAVHMIPAAAKSGAEWESFWASLIFELPPAAAAMAAKRPQ